MPRPRKHAIAQQQQGKPISAQALRHAGETLDWISNIDASAPLECLATANGPLIRYPGMLFEIYIGVVTTAITAASGATPGSGQAKVETWNGTALADLGGPVNFKVYTTGSAVTVGTYIQFVKIAGSFWIIGTGGSGADLWCQLGGSLGPATGSWPSITATTTTANVYQGSGTSLSLVSSGATIYNRRNVTWAASKTTFLVPSGSGFAIVDQDC